jgi:hypothetical protein
MNRRLLGWLAFTMILAACSSSHPTATPIPSPVATVAVSSIVLRGYEGAVDSSSLQVAKLSAELGHCRTATTRCQTVAASTTTVMANLLKELTSTDQLRESQANATVPPGISPLVVGTENDARAVRRVAGSISAHSDKAALAGLAHQIRRLATELDAWKSRE